MSIVKAIIAGNFNEIKRLLAKDPTLANQNFFFEDQYDGTICRTEDPFPDEESFPELELPEFDFELLVVPYSSSNQLRPLPEEESFPDFDSELSESSPYRSCDQLRTPLFIANLLGIALCTNHESLAFLLNVYGLEDKIGKNWIGQVLDPLREDKYCVVPWMNQQQLSHLKMEITKFLQLGSYEKLLAHIKTSYYFFHMLCWSIQSMLAEGLEDKAVKQNILSCLEMLKVNNNYVDLVQDRYVDLNVIDDLIDRVEIAKPKLSRSNHKAERKTSRSNHKTKRKTSRSNHEDALLLKIVQQGKEINTLKSDIKSIKGMMKQLNSLMTSNPLQEKGGAPIEEKNNFSHSSSRLPSLFNRATN